LYGTIYINRGVVALIRG